MYKAIRIVTSVQVKEKLIMVKFLLFFKRKLELRIEWEHQQIPITEFKSYSDMIIERENNWIRKKLSIARQWFDKHVLCGNRYAHNNRGTAGSSYVLRLHSKGHQEKLNESWLGSFQS